MANVMKQKPTMDPRYPTRGKIHMVMVAVAFEGWCYWDICRSIPTGS
jgi:hypothetical protein